jgi:hypothetical protein
VETPETGGAASAGGDGATNLDEIKARIAARGRKPSKVREAADIRQAQADLDALFDKDNWEEVVSMYFNARFAVTGHDGFLLSDKQRNVLSSTFSASMKVLLKIDPAYIALTVFGITFCSVVADKELRYAAIQRERKRRGEIPVKGPSHDARPPFMRAEGDNGA